MADALPTTTQDLLERMRVARAELQANLDRLDEAGYARIDASGWSVKDHLAHITAWNRRARSIVSGQQPYETFGLGEEQLDAMAVDVINAAIFDQNRNLPLAEVLAAFRDEHEKVLALAATLSDADLAKPYFPDDPPASRSTIDGIANNTYLHDAEHTAWIRSQLAR